MVFADKVWLRHMVSCLCEEYLASKIYCSNNFQNFKTSLLENLALHGLTLKILAD